MRGELRGNYESAKLLWEFFKDSPLDATLVLYLSIMAWPLFEGEQRSYPDLPEVTIE